MKLQGLKVLDLSTIFPGPYLTMHLADHGAEVIKIEHPGEGDPARHIGLADGPHTVFFRNLNRGKESIALDLKSETGKAKLLALADDADVFVEAFRPGVAKRLGVDYASLSKRNPRIVYCSISGFGQTGPDNARPAHDLAIQAQAGVLSLCLGDDGEPALPSLVSADLLSGLHGLAGVLMALLRRQTTGEGDYIDISMLDSVIASTQNILGPTLAENRQPNPKHERATGGAAFYRIYKTQDGGHIALAGQAPKFVHALLNELGRPDLAPLCLSGPGPHQKPVIDFLSETFIQATRRDWQIRLAALQIGFSPVNSLPEALADQQIRAREMILHDGEGRPHIANPIKFLREPAQIKFEAPVLNQHSDAGTFRQNV